MGALTGETGAQFFSGVIVIPPKKKPVTDEEVTAFSNQLKQLRIKREDSKKDRRSTRSTRKLLSPSERDHILAKTDRRCHICGGSINEAWQADHVRAHSAGGTHRADNYLPAHALCNNYRWDYSPEEFQFILKLGVWMRTQIEVEGSKDFVRKVAAAFLAHERKRENRQKKKKKSPEQ